MASAAAGDDSQAAYLALSAFVIQMASPPPLPLVTFCDGEIGAGGARLYQNVANDDAAAPLALTAPDAVEADKAKVHLQQAKQLVQLADPEMAGEIAVAGRQIVLADGTSGAESFGGAATFFLWGALLINPRFNADRLAMAESLAHESGHALLFALADAEALTQNLPQETYASPLRSDPRPMEGIVHATYVLARMNWLLRAIAVRCPLTQPEKTQIASMTRENARSFAAGLEVVRANARFTPTGREIFWSCAASMGELQPVQ